MKLLNRYIKLSVVIMFYGLLIGCGFKSALYLPPKMSNSTSNSSDNKNKDSININSENNIYDNTNMNENIEL